MPSAHNRLWIWANEARGAILAQDARQNKGPNRVATRATAINADAPAPAPAPVDGLQDLYRAYFKEVVIFISRKVGSGPPEPEDVAQQAFAKFASLRNPEAIENKRAFLYRVAANILSSYRRHQIVERKHAEMDAGINDIFGESDGISPERVLLNREQFELLADAVRKMPRRKRRLLLLNRVEGLSYAELARRFNVTETTVRRQVLSAIKELAAYAPDYDAGLDDGRSE